MKATTFLCRACGIVLIASACTLPLLCQWAGKAYPDVVMIEGWDRGSLDYGAGAIASTLLLMAVLIAAGIFCVTRRDK